MVNPNADVRGWTGNASEEPWRCGECHPPARSNDRHRIQHRLAYDKKTLIDIVPTDLEMLKSINIKVITKNCNGDSWHTLAKNSRI